MNNSGDEVVEKLLLKILEKMMSEKKKVEAKIGLELKEVDYTSPHGIYHYVSEKDVWRLVQIDGEAYVPKENGFHVIYFDNTRCSACRIYDLYWYPWVREYSRKYNDTRFTIVLCAWFARNCESIAASKTFKHWGIRASPTTLFLYVKNGKVVMDAKREGVLNRDKLVMAYTLFRELALKCK